MIALRPLLFGLIFLAACLGTSDAPDGPIPFEVVAAGIVDGPPAPVRTVLRTDETWRAFWARHGTTVPDVGGLDFSQEMLLVVALGARPSAGYSVEVTSVVGERGSVRVWAREVAPPDDATVATVITTPFQVVRLPRHPGTVTIELE